ncbi:FtsX-like permease family protein [Arthrobacter roseus]|uniref:FtsX-like permease family protein n=1 Tax=Arthrobacter roseus TaxID=136274 RepID=UPI001963E0E5|nr:FtsX-like permease family protein [Arthrobacter roseus]MBM7849287.1 hypothetical protein [Arthrobacter roseus]
MVPRSGATHTGGVPVFGLTRFMRARGRASGRILIVILLTLTFITAIISATVGYTQLAATQALRATAAQPFSAETFLRVHTSVPDNPDDAEAQLQRADVVMNELALSDGLQRIHSRFGPDLPLVPSAGTAVNLPAELSFVPVEMPAPDAVTPVNGSWNSFEKFESNSPGPVPAVLTAAAATGLELEVGQTFSVKGPDSAVRLELVAVVGSSPSEGQEVVPLLAAAQAVAGEGTTHAVAVPEGSLERFTSSPKIQWTLVLDPGTVSAADLEPLAAGLPVLKDRMLADNAINDGGVVATGGLAGTIATAAEATRAVQSIVPISIIILIALGLIGVVRLAGLLADSRSTESQLIGARGASSSQRTLLAAAEILPVALLASVMGWAIAVGVTPLLTSWTLAETSQANLTWGGFAEVAASTWFVPLTVLLTAVVVFAGLTFLQARRDGAPVTATERIGSFIVVAALAGVCLLSVFQFLLHGSPLIATNDGQERVNVLAAPAPALLILLFAAVALLIIAALSRMVEKRAGRRPGMRLFLAARQVSRRISLFVLPVIVIAATVGGGVFTAAFTHSAKTAQQTAAQLVNGSDIRVRDSGPLVLHRASDLLEVQKFNELDGVSTAEAIHQGTARAGTEDVTVTAVRAESLPGLLATDPSVFNAEDAATQLSTPGTLAPPALELNAQTSQVRFQLSTTGSRSEAAYGQRRGNTNEYRATITAWLQKSDGGLVPVDAGTVNLSASGDKQLHSLAFSLPDGEGERDFTAIAAVDISVKSTGVPLDFTVQLTSIATDAGVGTGENRLDGEQDLTLVDDAFTESPSDPLVDGAGAILHATNDQGLPMSARLISTAISDDPIPVVATADLLAALDLSVGENMPLRVGSANIPAVIADSVQALPGSGAGFAVLVDREGYAHAWLTHLPVPPRANEVWIAAEPEADVNKITDLARDLSGPAAEVTAATESAASRFLTPATAALWLGAIGALIIGAAALAASAAAMAAARRPEVSILRAVGVQAREQASGRRRELAWVGAVALVFGVVAGLGAALLTVPALAGITLVDTAVTFAVPFGVAVVPALLIVVAQAAVLAVAVWLYGRAVYRQSTDRAWVEDLR